jgi:hypothetical protein
MRHRVRNLPGDPEAQRREGGGVGERLRAVCSPRYGGTRTVLADPPRLSGFGGLAVGGDLARHASRADGPSEIVSASEPPRASARRRLRTLIWL